jgi:hypothetical protein
MPPSLCRPSWYDPLVNTFHFIFSRTRHRGTRWQRRHRGGQVGVPTAGNHQANGIHYAVLRWADHIIFFTAHHWRDDCPSSPLLSHPIRLWVSCWHSFLSFFLNSFFPQDTPMAYLKHSKKCELNYASKVSSTVAATHVTRHTWKLQGLLCRKVTL